ncbi:MAG: alpha-N-arabinofuranosidase [Opitutae bacterium]|nr:alpha-N-arabinofuranosidase [Opitutae bacterium]
MKRILASLLLAAAILARAGELSVDAAKPTGPVSPRLYGLMTEEINHSYDGGLYAELVRNRAFLDHPDTPVNWSVVKDGTADAAMSLDRSQPLNEAIPLSLRFDVTKLAQQQRAGFANGGYWGIPVQPNTTYRASFYAKAPDYAGRVTLSIESDDGKTVYASAAVERLSADWQRLEVVLKTGDIAPTAHARYVVCLDRPGTAWFSLVSLFPPTWNDRPNGLRRDIMQMLVDLKPKFLRFPGGNYLEGDRIEDRFPWQKTLGPIENRPGHAGCWGYRSSDGLGLLEFLEWCEDMKAEPVLAVFAGYSLKGDYIKAGPELEPFVQEALDEIEYVIGDANTTWGARRAKDGHPEPFDLHYVEIGNEDFFDKAKTYDGRYAQFHDAIKAKYPHLKLISSMPWAQHNGRKPDAGDWHDYSAAEEFVKKAPTWGADLKRHGPEVFVGEWAAHEDASARPWDEAAKKLPVTPSMKAAIGDAAFMAAMERNGDIVKMHCYAPLLANVNPGGHQWRPDLIGYDALTAYGSPSYYAFQMFSTNLGDELLRVASSDTLVQGCATRDSKTGAIIIKLVNSEATAQTLPIALKNVTGLKSTATVITLSGKPEDTNSISEPKKVAPVTSTLEGVAPSFSYTLPPTSVVILKLQTR